MKRDMDLVRAILLKLEEQEGAQLIPFLPVKGYSPEMVAEHCEMMHGYGLIKSFTAEKAWGGEIASWAAGGLTWEGYDYLDKIRDDSVWNKTKETIKTKGLPLIFDTIKSVSTAIITAATEGAVNSILKNGGQ